MINNNNLPVIPAKRYFSLAEVCYLANIQPEQLAAWQKNEGSIIGRGGRSFTRLDVIKIRQLQHGIADSLPLHQVDSEGNPAMGVDEIRDELQKVLTRIEKTLAS